MKMFDSWEDLAKAISVGAAALTTALTVVPKLTRYFTDVAAKGKLKRDLELLKLASETTVDIKSIERRITQTIETLYREKKKVSFPTIPNLIAAFLWVGAFSWWIYLGYQEEGLTPWTLLVALIGLIGLSAINSTGPNENEKDKTKKTPVCAVYVLSWANVVIHLTLLIGCYWGTYLLFVSRGISGWHLATITGALGGTYGLCVQFRVKGRKYLESKESFD